MARSWSINVVVLVIFLAVIVDCAGTSESKAIPKKRTFLEKLNNLVSLVDRGFRSVGSDIKTLYGNFDELASSVRALERRCKPVATTPQPDLRTPHPVVIRTGPEACGGRWTKYGTSFFSFCPCTQPCSFNSARNKCREKHAELAKCNSRELENFFILSLNTPKFILLGGNDRVEEGTWRWPDGSLLYRGYTNWYPGQPSGETGQNCLEWYRPERKWYDEPCDHQYSSKSAGFVCEKKHL